MANYPGYDEDYYVYHQCSNQFDVSDQWLKNVLYQTPEKIIKEGEDEIKILSVGSGAGVMDGVILDYILSIGRPVQHTSIEPDAAQITRFQSNISRNPKYTDIKFVILHMSSDEFLESNHSQQTFDLIIFFHCLYQLGTDLKLVLQKYYDMTATGGSLVAMTSGKRTGWFSLHDQFAGQIPLTYLSTGEDVDVALKVNGIHFNKEEIFVTLDIAPLLPEEEVGNSLLNFITQVEHARQTLPRALVKEIIAYLKSLASEDCGKLIVKSVVDIHLIKKP